ncbi:ABC transporter permease subunit [Paeniglutamicibacter cryotolerans]|uniref:Branched-chain amino acid transport system permease protein n=1 Tax=Paeniglutamicibacter cryotolerans TaxID=670079 RepID=A0A839QHA0_9MICC|nr:branched-chain amino acid ABC transporter ATP-binding protein/permease [Paeniglutamicibacter cryotolerans]MBB2995738.1 branched-chain amino acid transport system permease protein [Paeniglutamicibacter cryotolerans]
MLPAKNSTLKTTAPYLVGLGALAAAWLLSIALPNYLVFLGTTALLATIALIGLGIVTGTAGMIVLCQLTFAAVGAWVVSWCNVHGVPGGLIIWIIAGALVAAVIGLLLGLPALRLRGVNLAVVTLGFAAAADMTLTKTQFPGAAQAVKIAVPGPFETDRGYFLLAALATIVIGVAVYQIQRTRLGSAWKAVAFSERGAAAAGTSVRSAKLSAFAISAAIAGVAGGLMAGQVGTAYAAGFSTLQSLALYVLAIVAGAHLVEMALFGGILWVLIPELLKRWGVPQDWGLVVFGVLGIQALTTNSNLGADLRNAVAKRRRARNGPPEAKLVPLETDPARLPANADAPTLLEVRHLGVAFGQVKALNDVSFSVPAGHIVGLIGPNGAGKSTFVDSVSGFLPQHTGEVFLGGEPVNGLAPHLRARLGLRRTFQQDRVPPSLSVADYMAYLSHGKATTERIAELIEFFGCPGAGEKISSIDVGTRRIIEVAANIAADPKLLILDEPAAGLSHEEHVAFGQRLRQVPARYGTTVLIIEHDLDLVRSVCDSLVVLDFGSLLASGPQETVLNDPKVLKAYMGETEML